MRSAKVAIESAPNSRRRKWSVLSFAVVLIIAVSVLTYSLTRSSHLISHLSASADKTTVTALPLTTQSFNSKLSSVGTDSGQSSITGYSQSDNVTNSVSPGQTATTQLQTNTNATNQSDSSQLQAGPGLNNLDPSQL